MEIKTKYDVGQKVIASSLPMTIRYISFGPTGTYEYNTRWIDADGKPQDMWVTEEEIEKVLS